MSGCAALNCLIKVAMSRASWPSTGTGKNRSMSVALALPAVSKPTANAPARRYFVQAKVIVETPPLFQARGHEAVDETALEQQEADDERRHHEERAGRGHAPRLGALGAEREHGQTDGERPPVRRVDHHQRPQELVPMGGHRDD